MVFVVLIVDVDAPGLVFWPSFVLAIVALEPVVVEGAGYLVKQWPKSL